MLDQYEAQHVSSEARFNVLLTEDRDHAIEHWTQQLPRLLEPQGVRSYVVRSADGAVELTQRTVIHAAVIDLATPRAARSGSREHGGLWLLEVLSRTPRRIPIVVVNSPTVSQQQAERMLNQAMRLGAFSVLNRPVRLEALLHVIRRVLDREYKGTWPQIDNDGTQRM